MSRVVTFASLKEQEIYDAIDKREKIIKTLTEDAIALKSSCSVSKEVIKVLATKLKQAQDENKKLREELSKRGGIDALHEKTLQISHKPTKLQDLASEVLKRLVDAELLNVQKEFGCKI